MTRQRGFTLVEVLVALSIFAVAALVLSNAYVNNLVALDTIYSNYERDADIRFARAQITRIADYEELEDGGEITTLNSGVIEWEAEFEPTNVVDLFKVFVTFEVEGDPLDSAVQSEELQFEFYLLRPAWSEEDPTYRDDLIFEKQQDLEQSRSYQGF